MSAEVQSELKTYSGTPVHLSPIRRLILISVSLHKCSESAAITEEVQSKLRTYNSCSSMSRCRKD